MSIVAVVELNEIKCSLAFASLEHGFVSRNSRFESFQIHPLSKLAAVLPVIKRLESGGLDALDIREAVDLHKFRTDLDTKLF